MPSLLLEEVRKDAWAYAVSFVVSRGQPFLEAVGLSVFLEVGEFGVWSWAGALWAGAVALTHFGVPAAVFRYAALPTPDAKGVFWKALWESRYGLLAGLALLWGLGLTVPPEVRRLTYFFMPALMSQSLSEVLRSYYRAKYQNNWLAWWQGIAAVSGLGVVLGGAWIGGLGGAAWGKCAQSLLTTLLAFLILPLPPYERPSRIEGFWRFAWEAYAGNLALEALFFLPGWLLGWHTQDPTLLAYWRWATLIPLNLRQIAAQLILYLYPRWVQSTEPLYAIYRKERWRLWIGMGTMYAFAALWVLGWKVFPGEAYAEARGPYLLALLVSWIWSVEGNFLPNLLSARGYIQAYRQAYMVGLLGAAAIYLAAQKSIYLYLTGLGVGGLIASLYAHWKARRVQSASP